MKAVFVVYNQAYNQEIVNTLEELGQRGYTVWEEIGGRGTLDGEPHLGSHAWPTQNHALVSMMEDSLAGKVMESLRSLDKANPKLGLRAYILPVEQSL